jgi:hypothetical protein
MKFLQSGCAHLGSQMAYNMCRDLRPASIFFNLATKISVTDFRPCTEIHIHFSHVQFEHLAHGVSKSSRQHLVRRLA